MEWFIPELNQTLSRRQKYGAGSSGDYYRLSKGLGIKIFSGWVQNPGEETPLHIKKEFLNQVRAEPSGVSPKAYQIVEVKSLDDGKLYWGIVMDHIPGEEIDDDELFVKIKGRRVSTYQLYAKLKKTLSAFNVDHWDIHGGNVLIHKDKAWVIDFG